MSDEHSFSLHHASAEYRDLASKLRELARACIFPGPRRSLLRLAGSFDRRAAHFDCRATPGGAPWSARRPNGCCGYWSGSWYSWCVCRGSDASSLSMLSTGSRSRRIVAVRRHRAARSSDACVDETAWWNGRPRRLRLHRPRWWKDVFVHTRRGPEGAGCHLGTAGL